MSDVPSDLHREILLRLPAESLFRFRTVCKSWQSIIDDPLFVRSHTTNNHRTSPRLLIGTDIGAFYSFPFDSLNFVNGEQTIHATQVKELNTVEPQWMASCNGLILFFYRSACKNWVIWNTLTSDFHELPQPDVIYWHADPMGAAPMGAAIGYDSRSDDYKVVRIGGTHRQENGVAPRTLIYSLKSKSWRMILNWPADKIDLMTRGVYLNGAVHWITSRETIVALDLATEEYREFQAALPPTVSPQKVPSLDAFDGYLVLSNAYDMRRTWVMRGYGTNEPIWVELISAKEQEVFCRVERFCRLSLLAYSNSERCLFVQYANWILRWDIEKRSQKWVIIDGLPGDVTSCNVVPGSLFRLNRGGSTSFAMERTSEEASSRRLKLIATTIPSDGDPAGEMIKDIMKQPTLYAQGGRRTPRLRQRGYNTQQSRLMLILAQRGYGPTQDNMQQPQGPLPHDQPYGQQPNQPVEAPYQGPTQTYRQSMPPHQQQYPYAPSAPVQQTYPNPATISLTETQPPMYNGQQGPLPHDQPYGQQPRPNQPVEADPYQGAQTYGQSMPPHQQQCPYAPNGPVQQTYPNPPYGSEPASGGGYAGQTHPKKTTCCTIL